MYCKIFDLSEKKQWREFLNKLPEKNQDIYYSPEYYFVSEANGYGDAMCFLLEDNKNILLYPFLKNRINDLGFVLEKDYYDIQGAYGYNGPISNSDDERFLRLFAHTFQEYCRAENIVAEFTRFHPLLKNHVKAWYMSVLMDNMNVVLDLTIDDIWKNAYEYTTRKNINKANRNGLRVKSFLGGDLEQAWFHHFFNIYNSTMDRNAADSFYYFSEKYFHDLLKINGNNSLVAFTLFEDKPVSAEIVLFGRMIGYSYLGGTLIEYFSYRPNDILKDHIIFRLKEMGLRYFCLGGGSDGIIRFKKRFAKDGICEFYIGKKLHDEEIYDRICSEWGSKNPEKIEGYKHFLLKYRY